MPCSIMMLASLIVAPSFAADDAPATQQSYLQKHDESQKTFEGAYIHEGESYQQQYAGGLMAHSAEAPIWNPDVQNASDWSSWGTFYQQQYAGNDMAWDAEAYAGQSSAWTPNVQNTSDWMSWRKAYMKVYAGAYSHFVHQGENLPEGPEKASECQNVPELEKWRLRQMAEINAFTPIEYQNISKDGLEATFAKRKAQIEDESKIVNTSTSIVQEVTQLSSPAAFVAILSNKSAASHYQRQMADIGSIKSPANSYAAQWLPQVENVSNPKDWRDAFMKAYAHAYMRFVTEEENITSRFPDALAHARSCKTMKQLQQWRDASKARLQAFVPKDYQTSALNHVEKKFAEREAELKQEQQERINAGTPLVKGASATGLSVPTLAQTSVRFPLMITCMASVAVASTLRRWWISNSDGADVYLLHSEGSADV